MHLGDWIAAAALAVTLTGTGIRMIMKITRLTDSVDRLDTTISAHITDHEQRMHPHDRHHHRRAG